MLDAARPPLSGAGEQTMKRWRAAEELVVCGIGGVLALHAREGLIETAARSLLGDVALDDGVKALPDLGFHVVEAVLHEDVAHVLGV